MSLVTCLFIMLGGALGSLARYILSALLLSYSRDLPLGTVLINITGSFLIGFFGTLTLAHGRFPVSENVRLFVMVGVCGGYTTFSSFSLQTLDLMRSGATGRALINVLWFCRSVCLGRRCWSRPRRTSERWRPEIAQIAMEEEA